MKSDEERPPLATGLARNSHLTTFRPAPASAKLSEVVLPKKNGASRFPRPARSPPAMMAPAARFRSRTGVALTATGIARTGNMSGSAPNSQCAAAVVHDRTLAGSGGLRAAPGPATSRPSRSAARRAAHAIIGAAGVTPGLAESRRCRGAPPRAEPASARFCRRELASAGPAGARRIRPAYVVAARRGAREKSLGADPRHGSPCSSDSGAVNARRCRDERAQRPYRME